MKKRSYRAQKVNEVRWEEVADRVKGKWFKHNPPNRRTMSLIHRPMFYVRAFFETRRDEYYERPLVVSRDDDWAGRVPVLPGV
ncbi:MAG: hypothetical protein ACREWG_04220 [Gammaproteobacteria bacterium]